MKPLQSAAIALAIAFGSGVAAIPPSAQAYVSVGISVGFAPPPLPIYAQPPIPGPDYIWTPGYWGWDPVVYDYYWIPGTWIVAPAPGLLWTPAWWGWTDGAYLFHAGYWGPQVGFYGGVVYGFGYDGVGYQGGYWQGDRFYYNQAVNNVSGGRVATVFSRPVTINRFSTASFNGPGGVNARATAQQLAAERGQRLGPTAMQARNASAAARVPTLRVAVNHGAP